jgi:myo-inositol 2-dehydrogenase/D-chiro-inositol 1-dehydrogenase
MGTAHAASLMARFKLGLIGAGRMGRTHLRALAGSETVAITAICEPALVARNELAQSGFAAYASLDAMLDTGGLDGVLIAAPSDSHLALVRRAAAAGLPILCEKPCGTTAAQATEAARITRDAGVALQVAYWRRFVPALRRLRQRITEGEFGGIYLAACYQWDEHAPPAAFRAHSGGIFIDMGVHEFDQLRWLTGQDIVAVHASAATIEAEPHVSGDAESAQVLCDLSGGSTGLVSLGRRFPRGDVCWAHIFGTRDAEECRFLWPPDAEATFLQALRLQAESFARGADGSETDAARADDAVAALTAAEGASMTIFRCDRAD